MKIFILSKITKLYFKPVDVAKILDISENAALVTCNRYVKQGFLLRLKRNLYILKERWNYLTTGEIFEVANILQVPSYVSLTTGLSFYDLTTQKQQDFIESVSLKRTKVIEIEGKIFKYSKIKKSYYFAFSKKDNYFISEPEKAFLDCLYLQYLGRYRLDLSAVDLTGLDRDNLLKWCSRYPGKFRSYINQYTIAGAENE